MKVMWGGVDGKWIRETISNEGGVLNSSGKAAYSCTDEVILKFFIVVWIGKPEDHIGQDAVFVGNVQFYQTCATGGEHC